MTAFLPDDRQYEFVPLDTSQLIIKTDDIELSDWSDEPISPTPLYYGPFHDAMVDINQELDLGFQEEKEIEENLEEIIMDTVATKNTAKVPKLTAQEEMLKKDEKLSIKLEPLLQCHRTLRKRSTIAINYNEDQRSRRSSMTPCPTAIDISPSTTTILSNNMSRKKRNSLRISTSRATSLSLSSSSSSSPIPSAGLPDRFSACLLCRKRKIKCVPFRDSHDYRLDGTNNGKCGTCIRRGKECQWPKINVSRAYLSPKSESVSPRLLDTISPSTMQITPACQEGQEEDLQNEACNSPTKTLVQDEEASLTVIKDEEDKEMIEEQVEVHETPTRLSLRAFGRSTSSMYTPSLSPDSPSPLVSPLLSPCGSSSISSTLTSPSTPCWPQSPQTPHDQDNCPFISIITPTTEREQECLHLVPTLTSSYNEMPPY